MEQLSDSELVTFYRKGHDGALAILIQRHLPSVYRFLYRMVGDSHHAEDLAQETFLKAWKNISKFDPTKSFKTWVFSIAKNTAIDWLRKKHPVSFSDLEPDEMPDMADSIPDEQPLAPEILERAETAKMIEEALTKIPPKARSIVLMHQMEDMTFKEISEATGEPINTVKSRYRRALHALKEILAEGT